MQSYVDYCQAALCYVLLLIRCKTADLRQVLSCHAASTWVSGYVWFCPWLRKSQPDLLLQNLTVVKLY